MKVKSKENNKALREAKKARNSGPMAPDELQAAAAYAKNPNVPITCRFSWELAPCEPRTFWRPCVERVWVG